MNKEHNNIKRKLELLSSRGYLNDEDRSIIDCHIEKLFPVIQEMNDEDNENINYKSKRNSNKLEIEKIKNDFFHEILLQNSNFLDLTVLQWNR